MLQAMAWRPLRAARHRLIRTVVAQKRDPRERDGHPMWRGAVLLSALTLTLTLTLLAACGGGGGGTSSGLSVGNAQSPDPVVVDLPIAYIKRPVARDQNGALITQDIHDPIAFRAGAQLLIRERASASAAERVISDGAFATAAVPKPLYDVSGIEPSYDGKKLVFSMRAPTIPNSQIQPTWNIWIYDRIADQLRRVIASDVTAEQGDDIQPHFLPDGRIVFASNRQRRSRAVLLDEGKPQFSALTDNGNDLGITLHVMNEDGTDIRQITFNLSHDLDPVVLSDGRILFSRWDNVRGKDRVSLYTVNPDGSRLELAYGFNSHATGTGGAAVEFVDARPLADGRVVARLAPTIDTAQQGSDFVGIDFERYTDFDLPLPSLGNLATATQTSIFRGDVRSDATISPAGRYLSGFPLLDGTDRLLVTWSQCRLLDTNTRIVPCGADPNSKNIPEAAPLYGVWVYNPGQNTQQPVVAGNEGVMYDEAVVMGPRTLPRVILDPVPGVDVPSSLVDENAGILNIRSIYDRDGVDTALPNLTALSDPQVTAPDQRPARFIRIIKPVLFPPRTLLQIPGTAFGASAAEGMREIIGYAPIEPDGSVRMKVPADVAFTIALLDKDGQQISARHDHWLQVRGGETLTCHGCHAPNNRASHGRTDGEKPSINAGAAANGPFPNANPTLNANLGETMAEARVRAQGLKAPVFDLLFTDVWTDPARQPPAPAFAYRYNQLTTTVPTTLSCLTTWQSRCRAVIHYPAHIQPIFDASRIVLAADGVTVLSNHTCTTCHGPVDAMNAAQVPAAQLDLSGTPSTDEPKQLTSYRELFFGDNEQIVMGGVLIDRLVPQLDANGNPVFQLDAQGNPVLDANGQPVPVLVPVAVAQAMSPAGAIASAKFFTPFKAPGTHVGYLSGAELKLLREWLDIGAQYYNDPFVVPPP